MITTSNPYEDFMGDTHKLLVEWGIPQNDHPRMWC